MLRVTAFLLILIALTSCRRSKFDSEYVRINHGGENRSYLLHVPTSYDESIPVSLVFAFHGGTGTAKNIEEQSGLPSLSDEKGFILCSPNGMNRTWNAGTCCGKAQANEVDDVGFISALIDQIEEDYNIDPKRIYATGMSNGAMMSYRLACELGDRIAAVAPVAGTMVFNCSPSRPVSIIHFHSYEDSNVPWDGGVGDGLSEHYNPPLDSVLQTWVHYNQCISTITESTDDYDFIGWEGCDDGTEVQVYFTSDGGHSWPMGTQPRKKADEPSQAIDANELLWEFFDAHPQN